MDSDISRGLIGRKELKALVPYDPSYIAKLEKRGLFPRRIAIGPGKVGYLRSEIEAWLRARIVARDEETMTEALQTMREIGRPSVPGPGSSTQ